jgi:hypothetical protein
LATRARTSCTSIPQQVRGGRRQDGRSGCEPDWANRSNEKLEAQGVTVKGVVSNFYSYNYNKVMTKDQITGSACVVGFYLDKAST